MMDFCFWSMMGRSHKAYEQSLNMEEIHREDMSNRSSVPFVDIDRLARVTYAQKLKGKSLAANRLPAD